MGPLVARSVTSANIIDLRSRALRRAALIGGASALALSISGPAFAQDYGTGGDGGQSRNGVRSGVDNGGTGGQSPIGENGSDGSTIATTFRDEGGGGGGGGAGGGNGGNGGGSNTSNGLGGAGGAYSGAAGTDGLDSSPGRGGGGGGGGAHGAILIASSSLTGPLSGGDGGNGGASTAESLDRDGGAGGGGAGGYGVYATSAGQNMTINAGSAVAGGKGGRGGSAVWGQAGSGGSGGIGVLLQGDATLTNGGSIVGGEGGAGGSGIFNGTPGDGADGAAGVLFNGSNGLLVNMGTIAGGLGGQRTLETSRDGTRGNGGAAVIGADLTIINSGSIVGGLSAVTIPGPPRQFRANAVTFGAGENIFEHRAGGSVTGNVIGDGVGDIFRLGGTANGAFSADALGATYQAFSIFEKVGASNFTLTGRTALVTPWTITAGSLSIGNDQSLGATSGDLTIGAGELIVQGDVTMARNVIITESNSAIVTEGNTTISGSVSGAGRLRKRGYGTLYLSGDNSGLVGDTVLLEGMLGLQNSSALGSSELQVSGGTAIDYADGVTITNFIHLSGDPGSSFILNQSGGSATQSGVISGMEGLGFTKTGNGNLTISGANTYSGLTTVAAGTLTVTSNDGLGTADGGTIVQDGATLDLTNRAVIADALTLSGMGVNGVGALIASGGDYHAVTGGLTLTGDTLIAATGITRFGLRGGITGADADLTIFTGGRSWIYDQLSLGTGALTKSGGDVLEVRTANSTYSSFTVEDGSVIVVTATGLDPNSRVTLNQGAQLVLGQSNSIGSLSGRGNVLAIGEGTVLTVGSDNTSTTYSGSLNDGISAGDLALVKVGTGTLTLPRSNAYSGGTTIRSGTLAITGDGALGSLSGVSFDGAGATLQTLADLSSSRNIALTSDGIFETEADTTATFSGIVSGNGSLTKAGTGTLMLSGANTYTGGTSLDAGTIRVGSDNAFGTNGLTAANGTTLDFADGVAVRNNIVTNGVLTLNQSGGSASHSGALTGAGGITKTGTGALTLSGNQLYAGVTNVAEGTLIATGDFSLGTTAGNTIVENGATLDLQGIESSEAITISGAGVNGAGALRNSSRFATVNGRVTLAADATIASGTAVLELMGGIDGNHDLTINASSIVEINSELAIGDGDLAINGTGIVVLGRTNSFTGDVTVNGGNLVSGADDGNLHNTIGDTAALTLGAGTSWRLAQSEETIGSLGGNGDVYIDGFLTSGRIANLTVGSNNASTTFSGRLREQSNGVLSVTKTGGGTFTLTGNNTYSGGTVLSGGILGLDSSNALGTGTLQAANGTGLIFADGIDIANAIDLTGDASGTVGFGVGSGTATVSGIISGSAGILKGDPGTLVLTGANTYSGGTTISGGTIAIRADAALGDESGAIRFTGGTGTLRTMNNMGLRHDIMLDGSGTVITDAGTTATMFGYIRGTGDLIKAGDGILSLFAGNTYGGDTFLTGGTLELLGNDAMSTGKLFASGGTTISHVLNNTIDNVVEITGNIGFDVYFGTSTQNGVISGSGAMTKTGAGMLRLPGANTYEGGTTLEEGGLILGNNGALGAGALTAAANTSISFANNLRIQTAMSLGGQVSFEQAGGTAELRNTISGSGGLTKTGSGELIISGVNDYVGETLVSAGSLKLVGTGTLGTTEGGVRILGGGSLTLDGATLTEGVTVSGAGQGGLGALRATRLSSTVSGPITLADAATIGSEASVFQITGGIKGDHDLAITGSGNTIIEGGLNIGAGVLAKDSTGNLTLGGDNSFSGGTLLNAGRLIVLSDRALGTGSLTAADGTRLTFNNPANLANNVSLEGDLDVGVYFAGGTLSGTVSGSGSLTKELNGTLVLSGANTYQGGTFLTAGGLRLANDSALGKGALTASDGTLIDYEIGVSIENAIVLSGAVEFSTNSNSVQNGVISGDGILNRVGTGLFTLNGVNTFTGGTLISGGTLRIQSDASLGAATSALTFSGSNGTLLLRGDWNTARAININAPSGSIDNGGFEANIAGPISGPGRLALFGSGTVSLSGTNTYADGTDLYGGTLVLTNSSSVGTGELFANNGAALSFADAVEISNDFLFTGDVALNQTGGEALLSGPIAQFGTGTLTKSGEGSVLLSGTNSYSGTTIIAEGTLIAASASALGSVDGDTIVRNSASLELVGTYNTGESLRLAGTGAGGLGALQQTSGSVGIDGSITLLAASTIASNSGTLSLNGGISGAFDLGISGDVNIASSLQIGGGRLTKNGLGTLTLSGANTYSGGTDVRGGTLVVNGDQSGATGLLSVFGGATLAGSGIIGGDVMLADGASLNPGNSPGTMTINGNLDLDAGSILNFEFGEAGVVGGPLNDLVIVNGDLTLDGTLNVTTSAGGTFGAGVYRVFDYAGALIDNGLELGSIPASSVFIQTSVANQVNLVNTSGLSFSFWDGASTANSDSIEGGDGVWQSGLGNANWTDAAGALNGAYADGTFAIFQGTGGTVTVDNSLGDVTASGLQFVTDGYVVGGDTLTLTGGASSTIRVGDGTAGGAGVTATIAADLTGATQLVKTDLGTLVLSGSNTFSGTTTVAAGRLTAASNSALGSPASGTIVQGGATLALSGVNIAENISIGGTGFNSAGALRSTDGINSISGTVTLLDDASIVNESLLRLSGVDLGDNTLTLEGGFGTNFGGNGISGTGDVVITSNAGFIAGNSFTGDVTISSGKLLVFAGGASTIDDNAAVLLNAGGQLSIAQNETIGSLTGTGTVRTDDAAGAATHTLTVGGNNSSFTFDGVISEDVPLALVKAGTGTFTVTGNNTYSGTTTVADGTLKVTSNTALGSTAGDTIVENGATLALAGLFGLNVQENITLAGSGVDGSGALRADGGINSVGGRLTLTDATTIASNSALSLQGGITGDFDLTIAGRTTLIRSDLAIGTHSLIVDAGLVSLESANSFTGDVIVKSGTLQLGAGNGDSTIGDTARLTVNAGATVNLAQAGETIGSLTGSGQITSYGGDRRLTLGGDNSSTTFSGTLTQQDNASLALIKVGSGTFTLTGENSYTGGTSLDAGALVFGDAAALGTGALIAAEGTTIGYLDDMSVANAITLDGAVTFDPGQQVVTHTGVIGGTGSLIAGGGGTLILANDNIYSGGTILNGGVLILGSDTSLGTGALTATDGTTIGFTGNRVIDNMMNLDGSVAIDTASTRTALSGTISGAGSVTKTGIGTLTLSGANTYTGATNVQAGMLVVNGDQSGATGLLSVFGGATLAGSGIIGGDVMLADGASLNPGNSPGTMTINGNLDLDAGSILNFEFGEAGVVGGPLNDLVIVNGDLTLDGTLNVTTSAGGTFGAGVYRVFDYAGALIDNGLELGSIPASSVFIQTSVANQVNLVNTSGLSFSFWDGASTANSDSIEGGDGVWQSGLGNANWTDAAGALNGAYADGTFAIFQGTGGTVTVDNSLGDVTASGMQFVTDGYMVDGDMLTLTGGASSTIRVGDSTAGGVGVTAIIAANLTGATQLVKTDLGTLVLSGANDYTGGTRIVGGTLQVQDDSNLGAKTGAIELDGGKLATIASFTTARRTILGSLGGTIDTTDGTSLTAANAIDGAGSLTKAGLGTLILTADNLYVGGTIIEDGILQLGDGGTSGSILGDVENHGEMIFARSDDVTFAGRVDGRGGVTQSGGGTLVLTANHSYTGGTTITSGTLQLGNGGTTGSITGDVATNGILAFDRTDNVVFDGPIGGAGALEQSGSGALTLTGANSYAGTTDVSSGSLYINGDQSGAKGLTRVASNAALGGMGVIGGDVFLADGAVLDPGALGTAAGTLTINGDLTLAGGARLDYQFGAANVAGGALNDLVSVGGDLTLDGTLNVTTTAGGSFDVGVYRVFSYGGTLTDNGLMLGSAPEGELSVQTSVSGQINLVNSAGQSLNFWDGADGANNGMIDGGDGIWQSGPADASWTGADGAVNGAYVEGSFAIFQGEEGTVSINNAAGNVAASGLQFLTDGYVIDGKALTLVGAPSSTIRVGDGTAAGAGMTATISADLAGETTLVKADLGTLILSGDNSYSGGTAITDGTLQIAADANLGNATGGIAFDGGTLATTASFTIARDTTIGAEGGAIATAAGTILTYSGSIGGTGTLAKLGSGTLSLTGANTYSGATRISAGVLEAQGANVFSAASSHIVGSAATLDLKGFDQTIASLSNAGIVATSGAPGTTLSVTGDYIGNNGTLRLSAALGGENAQSDRLVIGGSTSGSTALEIINLGGTEAPTTEGIRVIDVAGASDGTFTLIGDYTYRGDAAIVAGAYGYRLYQNGVATPDDGDWYLRSSLASPGEAASSMPAGPLYQPGVPIYETYASVLQSLNRVATLEERVGDRSWMNGEGRADGLWGRMTGRYGTYDPVRSTGGATFDTTTWQAEIGVDFPVSESEYGVLVGSVTGRYVDADSDVQSVHGNGDINVDGVGMGAALTWYGNEGAYVDLQARSTIYDADLASALIDEPLKDGSTGLGYAFSAEAGKKVGLGGPWSMSPQAQFSYSRIEYSAFTDPFGADISYDGKAAMVGRLGLAIDYDSASGVADPGKDRLHLFGIANVYHNIRDSQRTLVSGTRLTQALGRTWAGVGLGGTYDIDEGRVAIFGQINASTGLEGFGDSYELDGRVGMRVRF